MDQQIKQLRAKSKTLDACANIGKEGITPPVLTELRRQLRTRKLIKIKVSKVFFGNRKKQKAQEVADALNAILVDQIGFVIVLARK